MIEIHPTAYVSPLADIEESVKGSKIIIGPDSYIDAFVKIKAAGGVGNITIGRQSFINSGCVLYIGNGISIGDNVKIVGQSGVTKSIKANQTVNGTPAFNNSDFNKSYVHFKNLPKIIKNFHSLEKIFKHDFKIINKHKFVHQKINRNGCAPIYTGMKELDDAADKAWKLNQKCK